MRCTAHHPNKPPLLDGKTGFLVNPGDVDAIADKLRQLLADPALRRSMGDAGRELVMRHYEARVVLNELYRFYDTLFVDH